MKKLIARACALALVTAVPMGSAFAQNQTTYRIDGQDAAKYYSRFMFRAEGVCTSRPVYFHYVSPRQIKNKIAVNAQGQDIVVNLAVFLVNSSEWIAYYEEHDVIQYTELGFVYDVTRPLTVRGMYRVVQDKMVLDGLGEASAIKYNGQNAMELVLAEDLITPGLKGLTLTMGSSISTYMPVPELDPCVKK